MIKNVSHVLQHRLFSRRKIHAFKSCCAIQCGPREQVVAGETGLLVPPETITPLAEALSQLATDGALRARMGAAGRARALERFDEANIIGRTLDLLGL